MMRGEIGGCYLEAGLFVQYVGEVGYHKHLRVLQIHVYPELSSIQSVQADGSGGSY